MVSTVQCITSDEKYNSAGCYNLKATHTESDLCTSPYKQCTDKFCIIVAQETSWRLRIYYII